MKLFARALLAALMVVAGVQQVLAQAYPTTTAVYTPHAVLPNMGTVTANATPSTAFVLNQANSMFIRVGGTFSALNATVQATELPGTSVTWQNISAKPVGGALTSTITAAGLYEVRVAGFKQVRVLVNTFTGTNVIFDGSAGGGGSRAVDVLPSYRPTYSASIAAFATAASATDFFTITGSANVTVRVINATCTATAGAAIAEPLLGIVRSTANATGTAVTKIPNDSSSPAAQALVQSYSANPGSLGTAVGTVRAGVLTVTTSATPIGAQEVSWDFGIHPGEQEITLRGATQVFALNLNSAAASLNATCSLTWTEE